MSRWRMQTAVFFLPVVFTATYWILISNNRPLKSSAWQARFCTKRTSPSKISSGNGTISNKLPVLTVPTSIIKCSTTYAAISTIRQYGRTVIRPACFATPIDNKLQIAAHAYSPQVLETAQQQKTTPKFERAKSMTFDDKKLIYVSGTAAIRGEESLTGVGLERQLHITMENIAQLTGDAQLKMLRVYLKNKSDYKEAYEVLSSYQLAIPVSYMCADVCRDELLIEIEGIAIK